MGNQSLRAGRYRHYKGKEYEVLEVARHSETEEEMVVYRTLYGEFGLWVRPLSMFLETVEINGELQPRFRYLGPMQKPPASGATTLLVIDAQVNMFDPQNPIHDADGILSRLQGLVQLAHQSETLVVFVQNNGGEDDPDRPGTPGWEIHPNLQPQDGDYLCQKSAASAFAGTPLHDELQQQRIQQLYIAGMQSEFCIDATTRHAVELGYTVTVIEDSHSTFDGSVYSAVEIIALQNEKFRKIAQTVRSDAVQLQSAKPVVKACPD